MTDAGVPPDPRPRLAAALDQLRAQADAFDPAGLDGPTPCGEFDVRTLLAHVIAVLRKLTVVGRGGDMAAVADPADDPAVHDWPALLADVRAECERTWGAADLDVRYAVPWGSMTGRDLLDAYVHEFTVHSWDLSRAGDGAGLDPELAEDALGWYRRNVPAERDAAGPFGPVVEVGDDADPYIRLAGYVGRATG